MEFVALREASLRQLRLPGKFRARVREEHVELLAERMGVRGQLMPILVRDSDMKVLDGLDRVAAAMLLKWDSIWCVLIECTNLEAEIIEREANMHRRHDKVEQRRLADELTERYEQEILAKQEAAPAEPEPVSSKKPKRKKRGRKPTAKGAARRRVAEELGVNESALAMSEWRKRKAAGEEPEMPIKLLGMQVDEKFRDQVLHTARRIYLASLRVSQAISELSKIGDDPRHFPAGRMQRLKSDAADLAAQLRNATPTSLCPCCKALEKLKTQCAGCEGTGFILKNQESVVPRELWDEENIRVQVGGQLRSVYDFVDPADLTEPPPVGTLEELFP